MKKILIIITAFLLAFTQVNANNDALIFSAMQQEVSRSMEGLQLPNMPAPFFINYIIVEGETIDINATLGTIITSNHRPKVRSSNVHVLTESPELTHDARFTNQGVNVAVALENDVNQIRRNLWLATNNKYKRSLAALSTKRNILRRMNLPEAERELKDFSLPTGVQKRIETRNFTPFQQEVLNEQMRVLSAIFREFPRIHSSQVLLQARQNVFYIVNSQGTEVRQPLSNVVIRLRAEIRADDGTNYVDHRLIVAENINTLPSQAELERIVRTFAGNLQDLANAPLVAEFYSGPVLFEGDAAADIFLDNLITPAGVLFSRRPIVAGNVAFTPNRPLGRKVVDTRLTVVNHTNKTSHRGISLVGAYAVDAEGVVPAARQVLVERGLLRQILNTSVPNQQAASSHGNFRLGPNAAQITTQIMPSVLEVQSSQALSPARLRQQLIRTARNEGLDYAYIVRQLSGTPRIYRVDVRTGQETLMRSPDIERITTRRLMRFDAVSNQEFVGNKMFGARAADGSRGPAFPVSIICPGGILLNDVEVRRSTANMGTLPPVTNPTER
ncbi:MAG: metallopeptidase TldD-related protein [Bacteroidales bacterium]|nr:metallopeptidase TldD-related protein [Bacteroidales bacterium]